MTSAVPCRAEFLIDDGGPLVEMPSPGSLALQCESFKPPFDDDQLTLEVISRLNDVPGFNLRQEDGNRWPTRQIDLLSNDDAFEAFASAFEWMFSGIETAEAGD